MGWRDVQEKAQQRVDEREASFTAGACPDTRVHYVTEVNKGSIRMQTWQGKLNDMYRDGYRLGHVFEQDGNTVQVFEHAHP